MLISVSKLNNLILSSDIQNILKNKLLINLEEEKINVKIIDDIPDELTDAITFDIVLNPVFIPISADNRELKIVDRKTVVNILRKGTNPFTRESITKEDITKLNTTLNSIERLDDLKSKIQNL
jgi:hypothetical protein